MPATSTDNLRLESVRWTCVKHAVQLAMIAAVLLFVLEGGDNPLMALSWVGAAFVALGSVVLVDRQRFRDGAFADDPFDVVQVITPDHAPLTLDAPLQVQHAVFVPQFAQVPVQHHAPNPLDVPFTVSVT